MKKGDISIPRTLQFEDREKIENTQETEVNIAPQSQLSQGCDFPLDGCQEDLRYLAEEVANAYQCPVEFVLAPMINVLSVVAGNSITLYDGKYTNTASHYMLLVAPSGSNKSQPLHYAIDPLLKINRELYKQWKQELDHWKSLGKDPLLERPQLKQLIAMDTTPEAKYMMLKENKNGILDFNDEIATRMNNAGRYNGSKSELSADLSLWDGKFDLSINRKGEDPMLIEKPFCSVMGTVQPSIIPSLFGSQSMIDSGYVSRIMFLFPSCILFPEYSEKGISQTMKDSYHRTVEAFFHKISGLAQPLVVTFSEEAKALYIEYYNYLQRKKSFCSEDYTKSLYAKLAIQCERWALSLHIVEIAFNTIEDVNLLSAQTMRYAIDCMAYFEHTTIKVRDILLDQRPNMQLSKKELITRVLEFYPDATQRKLAKALGISQQAVSKSLKS